MHSNQSRSGELQSILSKLTKLEESVAQVREQVQTLVASEATSGASDWKRDVKANEAQRGAAKTPSTPPPQHLKSGINDELAKMYENKTTSNSVNKGATFPSTTTGKKSSGMVEARLAAFQSPSVSPPKDPRPSLTFKKNLNQGNSSPSSHVIKKGGWTPPPAPSISPSGKTPPPARSISPSGKPPPPAPPIPPSGRIPPPTPPIPPSGRIPPPTPPTPPSGKPTLPQMSMAMKNELLERTGSSSGGISSTTKHFQQMARDIDSDAGDNSDEWQ